jgi:hypothetical protein
MLLTGDLVPAGLVVLPWKSRDVTGLELDERPDPGSSLLLGGSRSLRTSRRSSSKDDSRDMIAVFLAETARRVARGTLLVCAAGLVARQADQPALPN